MSVSLVQTENQPKIQHQPSVHVRIIFMKDVDFCHTFNLHILKWLQWIKMKYMYILFESQNVKSVFYFTG